MKKLIAVMLIIVSMQAWGQKLGTMPYTYRVKEHIPVLVSMLVAGTAEGFRDYTSFHYYGNNSFFGQDSWKNKYRHHDPTQGQTFAGKYFPMVTDGFHAMKAIEHTAVLSAITFKIVRSTKKKWYWYVLEAGTYYLANRAGFQIGYHLIKIK